MSKWNRIWGLLLLTLCFSLKISLAAAAPQLPQFSTDRVLVAFSPGTAAADIRAAHQQAGGQVIKKITAIGVDVISVPAGTVQEKIKLYERNPNVRYAEPNYLRPLIIPIEGNITEGTNVFDEQWPLHNLGNGLQTYVDPATQQSGWNYTLPDADIDAPEAWDISKGSSSIWVAVLDSGIDCLHPDLLGKCEHEEGYVSRATDIFGNLIPELDDQIGHGTGVAGIIAMHTNNGAGGAGVGWLTKVGSFKVCYLQHIGGIPFGTSCEDADIATALTAAADYGYDVINMSFGGEHSSVLQAAIDYAWNNGVVLIAAAGNNGNWEKLYPAAYFNVISVAATNPYDERAPFSSFSLDGDDHVDVMAPGDPILTTHPRWGCSVDQCYQWGRGSSFAAPHVSGIAALVKSYISGADNSVVRSRIEDCADQIGAMGQNMLAWSKFGRVNAYRALVDSSCDSSSPPPTGSVHVGDLDGVANNNGKYWSASITVLVHDPLHQPVSGAMVSGVWSEGASGSVCTTGGGGACEISGPDTLKKVSSITFTVNSVAAPSVSYNPTDDHDPDGDFVNGSASIIIAK